MDIKRIYLWFLCVILTLPICAQNTRLSEEEIQLQHQFIEAYKGSINRNQEKSLDALKELYKQDKNNPGILYQLATVQFELKDYKAAESNIQKAIKIAPQNFWYHAFLADLYEFNQEANKLSTPLRAMLDIKPDNPDLKKRLVASYIQSDQPDMALKLLQKIEKEHGIHEDISRQKFKIYESLDEPKKAVKELIKLCEAHPKNVRYLRNLANYYVQNKDSNKAKSTYQKILEIDPSNPIATLALSKELSSDRQEAAYFASIRNVVSNPDVAIDIKIKELIPFVENIDPSDDPVKIQELGQILELLQNTHFEDPKVFAIYGDYYMNTEQYSPASKKYIKTLELNKNVFPVWENLFLALEEKKDFDALLEQSESSLDYFPTQAICYYYNGLALNKLGKHAASDEALNEAILLSRKKPKWRYLSWIISANNAVNLGDVVAANEKIEKAQPLYEEHHPYFLETQELIKKMSKEEKFMRGIK